MPIAEMCKVGDPKLKYIDCIIPMGRRVSGAVSTSFQGNRFPIVLVGDHSLLVGSICGVARQKKIGVLWIDAHADFNTAESTPSGNIHGMLLEALCGFCDSRLVQLWEQPAPMIDPQRVAVIGARDLELGEKRNLLEAGVMVMSMEQIDRLGFITSMEKALKRISHNADRIYSSWIWT